MAGMLNCKSCSLTCFNAFTLDKDNKATTRDNYELPKSVQCPNCKVPMEYIQNYTSAREPRVLVVPTKVKPHPTVISTKPCIRSQRQRRLPIKLRETQPFPGNLIKSPSKVSPVKLQPELQSTILCTQDEQVRKQPIKKKKTKPVPRDLTKSPGKGNVSPVKLQPELQSSSPRTREERVRKLPIKIKETKPVPRDLTESPGKGNVSPVKLQPELQSSSPRTREERVRKLPIKIKETKPVPRDLTESPGKGNVSPVKLQPELQSTSPRTRMKRVRKLPIKKKETKPVPKDVAKRSGKGNVSTVKLKPELQNTSPRTQGEQIRKQTIKKKETKLVPKDLTRRSGKGNVFPAKLHSQMEINEQQTQEHQQEEQLSMEMDTLLVKEEAPSSPGKVSPVKLQPELQSTSPRTQGEQIRKQTIKKKETKLVPKDLTRRSGKGNVLPAKLHSQLETTEQQTQEHQQEEQPSMEMDTLLVKEEAPSSPAKVFDISESPPSCLKVLYFDDTVLHGFIESEKQLEDVLDWHKKATHSDFKVSDQKTYKNNMKMEPQIHISDKFTPNPVFHQRYDFTNYKCRRRCREEMNLEGIFVKNHCRATLKVSRYKVYPFIQTLNASRRGLLKKKNMIREDITRKVAKLKSVTYVEVELPMEKAHNHIISGLPVKVDDESLINFVEKKKSLYQQDCKNKKLISAHWQQCSNELGVSVIRLKSRWAFLKNNLLHQYRCVLRKKPGIVTKKESVKKGPLIDKMKFLIPYIQESLKKCKLELDLQSNEDSIPGVYDSPEAYYELKEIDSVSVVHKSKDENPPSIGVKHGVCNPEASENIVHTLRDKKTPSIDMKSRRSDKPSMTFSLSKDYDMHDDAQFFGNLLPMLLQAPVENHEYTVLNKPEESPPDFFKIVFMDDNVLHGYVQSEQQLQDILHWHKNTTNSTFRLSDERTYGYHLATRPVILVSEKFTPTLAFHLRYDFTYCKCRLDGKKVYGREKKQICGAKLKILKHKVYPDLYVKNQSREAMIRRKKLIENDTSNSLKMEIYIEVVLPLQKAHHHPIRSQTVKVYDEALINAIEQKKPLYDQSISNCSDSNSVKTLWEQCSEELGTDVSSIEKRWTFLRNYFVEQYHILTGENAGRIEKKWHLYDKMKFLIPYLQESQEKSALDLDLQPNEGSSVVVCNPEMPNYTELGSSSSVPKVSEPIGNVSESKGKGSKSTSAENEMKESAVIVSESTGNVNEFTNKVGRITDNVIESTHLSQLTSNISKSTEHMSKSITSVSKSTNIVSEFTGKVSSKSTEDMRKSTNRVSNSTNSVSEFTGEMSNKSTEDMSKSTTSVSNSTNSVSEFTGEVSSKSTEDMSKSTTSVRNSTNSVSEFTGEGSQLAGNVSVSTDIVSEDIVNESACDLIESTSIVIEDTYNKIESESDGYESTDDLNKSTEYVSESTDNESKSASNVTSSEDKKIMIKDIQSPNAHASYSMSSDSVVSPQLGNDCDMNDDDHYDNHDFENLAPKMEPISAEDILNFYDVPEAPPSFLKIISHDDSMIHGYVKSENELEDVLRWHKTATKSNFNVRDQKTYQSRLKRTPNITFSDTFTPTTVFHMKHDFSYYKCEFHGNYETRANPDSKRNTQRVTKRQNCEAQLRISKQIVFPDVSAKDCSRRDLIKKKKLIRDNTSHDFKNFRIMICFEVELPMEKAHNHPISDLPLKINDEDVIDAVVQIKPLYDRNFTKYKNRKLLRESWKQCAKDLGIDESLLKERWRYLRSYFTHQYRTYMMKKEGFPVAVRKTKWQLYDKMKFLIPHIHESKKKQYRLDSDADAQMSEDNTAVMYLPETSYCSVSENNDFEPQEVEFESIVNVTTGKRSLINDEQSPNAKKSCKTNFSSESSLPLKNESIVDDDAHFLESLLPMMRQLDLSSRLEFRIEAQSLLLQCQKRSFQMSEMFHDFHPSESIKTITIGTSDHC